jgi:hypothetical protein
MSLTESEFAALRHTIAIRGTVRIAVLPLTIFAWAAVSATLIPLVLFDQWSAAVLLPLAILVGGFEAIHALHVGAERIGRYLQVFYESGDLEGPRWETTAMAVGPALPGGGIDPLFTVVFASTTVINMAPAAWLPFSRPALAVAIAVLHGAFLLRLFRSRVAAARQRAVELESFRALKSPPPETKP